MEKNNFLISLLVVVLCVFLGVGFGYFLGNKNNNVTESKNNEVENSNELEKDDNLNSSSDEIEVKWVNYILNQNIKEIYINIWGDNANGEYFNKNIELSKSELEDLFKNMVRGNLKKRYFSGSGDSTPTIIVKYLTSDNVEFTLSIAYGEIISSDSADNSIFSDKNLEQLLELEKYELDGTKDEYNFWYDYQYEWDSEVYLNSLITSKS